MPHALWFTRPTGSAWTMGVRHPFATPSGSSSRRRSLTRRRPDRSGLACRRLLTEGRALQAPSGCSATDRGGLSPGIVDVGLPYTAGNFWWSGFWRVGHSPPRRRLWASPAPPHPAPAIEIGVLVTSAVAAREPVNELNPSLGTWGGRSRLPLHLLNSELSKRWRVDSYPDH
jgi:hypothetical protein